MIFKGEFSWCKKSESWLLQNYFDIYEEYNKVVVLDVGNRNEIYSFSNVAKIVETSILEREKIEEDDK